jgi:hypothetical protein
MEIDGFKLKKLFIIPRSLIKLSLKNKIKVKNDLNTNIISLIFQNESQK